jgi:hypothetical protein
MKMKRFKTMLVALVAVFALMMGAKEASAQTGLTDNILTPPTGSWVSSVEADGLLNLHVSNMKNLLLTLTPGTQAYKNVERSVYYYDRIRVEVADGKDIPTSIVTGLGYISQDALGGVTKAQLWSLRSEAIDMLSQ